MSETESRPPVKSNSWDDRLHLVLVGALPIVAIIAYVVVRAVDDDGLRLVHGSVSKEARDLLWFALICGLASYATIETAKRIARSRGHFQRWQTRRWMDRRERRSGGDGDAYDDLLRAWGVSEGEALRIFDLSTEQLAAQIGSAVDVALTAQGAYPGLIECFAGLARPVPGDDSDASPGDRERLDDFKLAQRMRLGVDQLHIALADRWRRTVQGAALWIAGFYGIAVAHAVDQPSSAEPRYVLAALLIGGPIAWLVRDASALLEHARH